MLINKNRVGMKINHKITVMDLISDFKGVFPSIPNDGCDWVISQNGMISFKGENVCRISNLEHHYEQCCTNFGKSKGYSHYKRNFKATTKKSKTQKLKNGAATMKIINYTEAKTSLRKTLDECERTSEPVCIVSRNNQMIIISKAEYDRMQNIINKVK